MCCTLLCVVHRIINVYASYAYYSYTHTHSNDWGRPVARRGRAKPGPRDANKHRCIEAKIVNARHVYMHDVMCNGKKARIYTNTKKPGIKEKEVERERKRQIGNAKILHHNIIIVGTRLYSHSGCGCVLFPMNIFVAYIRVSKRILACASVCVCQCARVYRCRAAAAATAAATVTERLLLLLLCSVWPNACILHTMPAFRTLLTHIELKIQREKKIA